jgi:tetratricopeptide (TPR) repeat protein
MRVALWLLCAAAGLAQPDPAAYRAYERANALFVARKMPECQAALDEALRLDPKLVPALTLQAKLAMAVNRNDLARKSLNRALAVDANSFYARFLSGFLYYVENDLQLARPELERARQLNRRDPRTALYLALTEESLGDTAAAERLYREAIRLEEAAGKVQTDTLLAYGRSLLLLGRLEESARLIERALKLEPDSRDAHYERARLLLKQGDAAGAAREGETALRLTGVGITENQIRYLLVRAYQAAGQDKLAAEHAAALRAAENP